MMYPNFIFGAIKFSLIISDVRYQIFYVHTAYHDYWTSWYDNNHNIRNNTLPMCMIVEPQCLNIS